MDRLSDMYDAKRSEYFRKVKVTCGRGVRLGPCHCDRLPWDP